MTEKPSTRYAGSPQCQNRSTPIDEVSLAISRTIRHEISERSRASAFEPYIVRKSPDQEISFFGAQNRIADDRKTFFSGTKTMNSGKKGSDASPKPQKPQPMTSPSIAELVYDQSPVAEQRRRSQLQLSGSSNGAASPAKP